MRELIAYAESALETVTRDRRALHRIPEEGLKEYKTQAYLMERLASTAPDELTRIAGTGIKAVYRAENPSEGAVGYRADIDALAVYEKSGVLFPSLHEGMMHACGHDGHMAVLLSLADYVSKIRRQLSGDVVLLFQPAEESVGGAKRMIDEGALLAPDVVRMYGMHVSPLYDKGVIAVKAGEEMSGTTEFDVRFTGESCHGAMPHLGKDCAAAAAHFILLAQTLLSRRISPQESAVITVGKVSAGTRRNIVAGSAVLEATMRAFSDAVMAELESIVRSAIASTEAAFGVTGEMLVQTVYPPVVNPVELTEDFAARTGAVTAQKLSIAEDFSYFQRSVPAVYFFCGIGEDGKRYSLHSDRFALSEDALLYGLEAFIKTLPIR